MKKIFQQNLFFLLPYLIFLVTAGIFLSLHSKADAHLIINRYRHPLCDYFFYYSTYLGDGVTIVIIVALLCFVRYRYAVLTGLSNILASLITQTLKHTLFSDVVRPKKFFEGIHSLNLVPWVENYSFNSFPSGHTTAAFTTCFCLALITKKKTIKLLLFTAALTIGFSRVYLSQHFLNDVYAGSLIGVMTTLLVYKFVLRPESADIKWMERSVIRRG